MIGVGDSAPDFTLPGTDGESVKHYSLTDYTDEGAVILVFYPFDFSPICTQQLCDFRDAEFLTFSENVDVFGISPDSCYAHDRFIEEHDLNFPLLSDTRCQVTDDYGLAYTEWELHSGVPKRALITVDDSQTVQYTWVTEDAAESPTLDELHDAVKAVG